MSESVAEFQVIFSHTASRAADSFISRFASVSARSLSLLQNTSVQGDHTEPKERHQYQLHRPRSECKINNR